MFCFHCLHRHASPAAPSRKVSEARGISGSKEPNAAFARTRSRGNITALKQLRAAPSTEAEILRQTDVEVDKGKQKHVRGNYKPGEKSPMNNLTLQCIQPCLVLCQRTRARAPRISIPQMLIFNQLPPLLIYTTLNITTASPFASFSRN